MLGERCLLDYTSTDRIFTLGSFKIVVGKLEGKRPRGRPRRRWEDNIRMDLREIGREGVG
jgi:hypothetical protein